MEKLLVNPQHVTINNVDPKLFFYKGEVYNTTAGNIVDLIRDKMDGKVEAEIYCYKLKKLIL